MRNPRNFVVNRAILRRPTEGPYFYLLLRVEPASELLPDELSLEVQLSDGRGTEILREDTQTPRSTQRGWLVVEMTAALPPALLERIVATGQDCDPVVDILVLVAGEERITLVKRTCGAFYEPDVLSASSSPSSLC